MNALLSNIDITKTIAICDNVTSKILLRSSLNYFIWTEKEVVFIIKWGLKLRGQQSYLFFWGRGATVLGGGNWSKSCFCSVPTCLVVEIPKQLPDFRKITIRQRQNHQKNTTKCFLVFNTKNVLKGWKALILVYVSIKTHSN